MVPSAISAFPPQRYSQAPLGALHRLPYCNYFKNITSLLLSAAPNEGAGFVPYLSNSTSAFDTYVTSLFPPASVLPSTVTVEPVIAQYGTIPNMETRMARFVGDYSFYAHASALMTAYEGKTYLMEFSRGIGGYHGLDIIPTFWLQGTGQGFGDMFTPGQGSFGDFATTLQRYLARHAMTGDPNADGMDELKTVKENGVGYARVMDAGAEGFMIIESHVVNREFAEWWVEWNIVNK
ncbi:hypothetical protein K402DRAFT_467330 [Aulographum hederae CBS 113979]|uniref:Alpha/beta-hydrolase n=1 Tax=Aulographum hederae CBS 113979 TaxID=1176131 RepID=A0A6G1GLE6_9PEZI|nr:hypothetical protein K402DRAFT_467330 [Aulographum hederae CBS 113979]